MQDKNHRNMVSEQVSVKTRLNLNDLLRRRMEEKKIDSRANKAVFIGAVVVGLVVLLILNI